MNHPIIFLDWDNKTKLVPASFSYILKFLWEKQILAFKSEITITIIIIKICIIKKLIKPF